jgi:hypothetical protein
MFAPTCKNIPAISVRRNTSRRKTPVEAQAMQVPRITGTIAAVKNGARISENQIRAREGFGISVPLFSPFKVIASLLETESGLQKYFPQG